MNEECGRLSQSVGNSVTTATNVSYVLLFITMPWRRLCGASLLNGAVKLTRSLSLHVGCGLNICFASPNNISLEGEKRRKLNLILFGEEEKMRPHQLYLTSTGNHAAKRRSPSYGTLSGVAAIKGRKGE